MNEWTDNWMNEQTITNCFNQRIWVFMHFIIFHFYPTCELSKTNKENGSLSFLCFKIVNFLKLLSCTVFVNLLLNHNMNPINGEKLYVQACEYWDPRRTRLCLKVPHQGRFNGCLYPTLTLKKMKSREPITLTLADLFIFRQILVQLSTQCVF